MDEECKKSKTDSNCRYKTGIASCFFQSACKQDPYVLKAAEKAKNKLRNCIMEINGGHN